MRDDLNALAIAYVKELFSNDFGGHDVDHTLRVYRNAMKIAETEPTCHREVVGLAALLHDVDDHKLFNTTDNFNARTFMKNQNMEEYQINQICEIIYV